MRGGARASDPRRVGATRFRVLHHDDYDNDNDNDNDPKKPLMDRKKPLPLPLPLPLPRPDTTPRRAQTHEWLSGIR